MQFLFNMAKISLSFQYLGIGCKPSVGTIVKSIVGLAVTRSHKFYLVVLPISCCAISTFVQKITKYRIQNLFISLIPLWGKHKR